MVRLSEAEGFCFEMKGFFSVIFERAGDSTGGRAHNATRIHSFVVLNSFMSVLPVHETQKSQSAMEDRRETGWFFRRNDVTVWDLDPGPVGSTSLTFLVFDPAPLCVFFEHAVVGFCPIEHDAAHPHLAQGRNVISCVAWSLFVLAGS